MTADTTRPPDFPDWLGPISVARAFATKNRHYRENMQMKWVWHSHVATVTIQEVEIEV